MDRLLAGREYASHLTEADLRLLASVADTPADAGQRGGVAGPAADASWLRRDPAALLRLLEHPGVFRAVLGQGDAAGWAAPASPFLVFAVFVQRAAAELASMDYVPERTGPGGRADADPAVQRARPGAAGGPAGGGSAGRTARRVPQARRRDAVPDRGVSRLRDRPRPRPGQCRPAAARRPAAGRAAGPPGRLAGYRVLGAPRCPLVPGRPRSGAGCHRAA